MNGEIKFQPRRGHCPLVRAETDRDRLRLSRLAGLTPPKASVALKADIIADLPPNCPHHNRHHAKERGAIDKRAPLLIGQFQRLLLKNYRLVESTEAVGSKVNQPSSIVGLDGE